MQRRVALMLNDEGLALRCEINEAYSYIHSGYFEDALAIIRRILRTAKENGDYGLIAVCRSARLFCKRVRKVNVKDDNVKLEDTYDELHRIRIGVKKDIRLDIII